MKKLLSLLLSAMLVLAMVPAIGMAEETITIDFMIENRADSELEGFTKLLIEPFEAEHPGVKINVIPTADTMTVVRTQLSAGQGADLVIAVFDGAAPLTDEDRALIDLCRGKRCLAVINKSVQRCRRDCINCLCSDKSFNVNYIAICLVLGAGAGP